MGGGGGGETNYWRRQGPYGVVERQIGEIYACSVLNLPGANKLQMDAH